MKNLTAASLIAFAALLSSTGIASAVPGEDESAWDCATMGNRICGPGNVAGLQAGQYANGVLVPWSSPIVPAWCKDICLGA